MPSQIKFLPLGGADEIGASSFYLNISGTGILLDCGIHPRKTRIDALPKFDLLNELPLDFVIISHAHQDHIGSLPFLIKKFPHVIVHTTLQTKEIAEITLHNAANILAENLKDETSYQIYTHDEIDLLVKSIREVEYNVPMAIKGLRHHGEEIKITFIDAGHILGSAGILIEHTGGKIFYTGDINLSDQSIMIGADLSAVKKLNALILETTYGASDSEKIGSWKSESKRFAKAVNKILHKGGSILIPVFALGKTQEILSMIHELMKKGELTETNIYTGGIGKEISRVYDKSKFITRRRDRNFELNEIPQNDLFEIEDYNHLKKHPGIVLASSGMMIEGTSSFKLMKYWLAQKDFAIFGVGYMDPDTPGFKVINSKRGDKIHITDFDEERKVMCEVERFYFPSHSKREDLLKIVEQTNPEKVILVHGEAPAKSWVGKEILTAHKNIKVYSAEDGSGKVL